jgi:hypothetical protein
MIESNSSRLSDLGLFALDLSSSLGFFDHRFDRRRRGLCLSDDLVDCSGQLRAVGFDPHSAPFCARVR